MNCREAYPGLQENSIDSITTTILSLHGRFPGEMLSRPFHVEGINLVAAHVAGEGW